MARQAGIALQDQDGAGRDWQFPSCRSSFMFFVSYALLNRTLVRGSRAPWKLPRESSRALVDQMSRADSDRMSEIAKRSGGRRRRRQRARHHAFLRSGLRARRGPGLGSERWRPSCRRRSKPQSQTRAAAGRRRCQASRSCSAYAGPRTPRRGRAVGIRRQDVYLLARARAPNGYLLAGRIVPDDFQERMRQIDSQTAAYERQRQQLRTYKNQMLLTLSALHHPAAFCRDLVRALSVQASHRARFRRWPRPPTKLPPAISKPACRSQAQDELGTLVRSFNA